MAKEAALWSWFSGGIKMHNPEYARTMRLERVENVVAVGMPDVSYTIMGVDGWIENKAVDLPIRESTRVLGAKGLNHEQVAWHRYHVQCGGLAWVMVHAKPWRWLVHSRHAVAINEMSVVDLTFVADWKLHGNMQRGDWRGLMSALQAREH